MGEADLVHRPRAVRGRRRTREVEELDPDAVAREVDRLQLRTAQPEQRVRRLALHLELVLRREAEQVAIESQRPLEVGHADADVREPLDRDRRHRAASSVIVTLIDPVVLSAAVRKPSATSASAKRWVTKVSPIRFPSRASMSCTISKSAREPTRL